MGKVRKNKRNFYYFLYLCFRWDLEFGGNFGTNSSDAYKKMVEFRKLGEIPVEFPRRVHQILEIQRNPEDFEDCKEYKSFSKKS